MKPAPFEYLAADTLDQAVALLQDRGAEAKLLAGGQSLVPLMNLRLARPQSLIDLNPAKELAYVREQDGALTIGAMTRHHHVASSGLIREHAPLLAAAAANIGFPAIRHRGTIGGSCAHADPAAGAGRDLRRRELAGRPPAACGRVLRQPPDDCVGA